MQGPCADEAPQISQKDRPQITQMGGEGASLPPICVICAICGVLLLWNPGQPHHHYPQKMLTPPGLGSQRRGRCEALLRSQPGRTMAPKRSPKTGCPEMELVNAGADFAALAGEADLTALEEVGHGGDGLP